MELIDKKPRFGGIFKKFRNIKFWRREVNQLNTIKFHEEATSLQPHKKVVTVFKIKISQELVEIKGENNF